MMQKSVYTKLALNMTAASVIMENVRKNKPEEGIVQMLTVTEKQYSKIELLVGESNHDMVDSTSRLIVL